MLRELLQLMHLMKSTDINLIIRANKKYHIMTEPNDEEMLLVALYFSL